MKILIVTDAWYPQINGVVRTYEYLTAELVKAGHEVKVIGPADFRWQASLPGYAEIKLALFPYGRLRRMIRYFAPDHIHIATEGPLGWAARRYCIRQRRVFTSSYHTHFPDYVAKRIGRESGSLYRFVQKIARGFVRRFHDPSTAVMAATPSLEKELRSWGFKPRLVRLSRGVDFSVFYPGEKTLFAELKRPVALYVGRVAIEKNLEDFLNMPWRGSKVLVGDGPNLSALKAAYPEAVFTGKKTGPDLAEHYRSADVFVFPSRTDTFGIVLIEAMACGLPSAGYSVTGPVDILTAPFLGATHADDLAAAAAAAITHGDSQKMTEYARTHYTWENASQQFLAALDIK